MKTRLPVMCTLTAVLLGLFSLASSTRAGVLTTLHVFNVSDGQYPQTTLVPGTNGSFYGATSYGGTYGHGTIFQITTNGIFIPVVSFADTNGSRPFGRLFSVSGVLYGTTAHGGPFDHGIVFYLSASNTIVPQLGFTNSNPEGSLPMAGLTADTNAVLFGASGTSGAFGYGNIFRFNSGDTQPTIVHSFNSDNGAYPWGTLLLNTNGWLYGTTLNGGSNNVGTLFKVSSAGEFTNFFSFATTNGATPWSGLIQVKNGALYGTTSLGGAGNYGTIFRVTTNELVEMVAEFAYTNGAKPLAELTEGADGSLYGVTMEGGANGKGTIFKVTTNGALVSLFSFNSGNGSEPYAGMAFGSDGHLYGTTQGGGNGAAGTSFRFILNPPAPVIQSVTATNSDVFVQWSAVAGGEYRLQYKTNLDQPGWINLGFAPITATNSLVITSDSAPSDMQRFYRAVLLQ